MTSPDHLSPSRRPSAEPEPLPFGMTWGDLATALPGFAGGGIASVSHLKQGRHQGGQPSVILTLTYVGRDGRSRERTVFVKQNPDDCREAETYRYLTGRLPVPDLLLCLDRAHNEVLGLEFVPSIGLESGDVDDLLHLVAALNSLTKVPATIAATRPGMAPSEFELLLEAATEHVGRAWPELRPDLWVGLYREAVRVCGDLPRALTHGELAAQQVGRTQDGRLVLFDWATVGERARLADFANVLQLLASLSGQDGHSLLSQYLRHLSAAGGTICSLERAWAELRLTRFVGELEALPWRIGLDDSADLHHHLLTIATDCQAVLSQLRA